MISSCLCFSVLTALLLYVGWDTSDFYLYSVPKEGSQDDMPAVVSNVMKTTLSLSTLSPEVQCLLHDQSGVSMGVKFPSLESFLRISATTEGQELRLSGLAVFSKLANACQPLVDISKSSIQVNKVALISLKDEVDDAVCPFRKLTTNAQNARYSVVILSLKIEIY